ncbi:tetratricopeptide repeat protein [Sorangium sp. So ce1389]|uniref:tetratricopeptide repeat protein n=1 Tax=Sorangium sp. So ce1389 TaxID=3133336 RepID=UPI003F629B05
MSYGSVGFYLLLAGTLCASSARAQTTQTSPQQDKAVAVALAERGWDHYEAHRYTEALRAFHEAEARAHAPAFLLMVARCNVKLGRLLDARAAYQLIVDEKLAPGAPPEFAEAKTDAKKELAALEPRVPTVEVAITGAAPGAVNVTLDGEQIALSAPVQRDPGHHPLVIRVRGRSPLVRTIWLVEGARERIEIDEAEIKDQPATARPEDAAGQRTTRFGITSGQKSAQNTRTMAGSMSASSRPVVLIGGSTAAGLGLATGAILTMVANGRASDARRLKAELVAEDQGNRLCPTVNPQKCADLSDAVDARVDFSNSAFWSFVAGGAVGVGTLIYGLVTMESAAPSRIVRVRPLVGPHATGLFVSGFF